MDYIIATLRTAEAQAVWRAAASIVAVYGDEGDAIAATKDSIGFGLSTADAELLIHHIRVIAEEQS